MQLNMDTLIMPLRIIGVMVYTVLEDMMRQSKNFKMRSNTSYNDVKAYINWGLVLFHQNKIYKAKEAFIVGVEKIVHDQEPSTRDYLYILYPN